LLARKTKEFGACDEVQKPKKVQVEVFCEPIAMGEIVVKCINKFSYLTDFITV
jgi:hypothetical protein